MFAWLNFRFWSVKLKKKPQILQFDKLSLNIVGKFYSVFTDLLLIYSVISKSRFLPWKKKSPAFKIFYGRSAFLLSPTAVSWWAVSLMSWINLFLGKILYSNISISVSCCSSANHFGTHPFTLYLTESVSYLMFGFLRLEWNERAGCQNRAIPTNAARKQDCGCFVTVFCFNSPIAQMYLSDDSLRFEV